MASALRTAPRESRLGRRNSKGIVKIRVSGLSGRVLNFGLPLRMAPVHRDSRLGRRVSEVNVEIIVSGFCISKLPFRMESVLGLRRDILVEGVAYS